MGKGVKGFQIGNKQGVSKRFSMQNQPKNRGRKLSFYKKAQKDSNYSLSKHEFVDIIRWMVEIPLGELEELQKKRGLPVWMIEFASALLKDAQKGRIKTLNYSFNLMFGKCSGRIVVKRKFTK